MLDLLLAMGGKATGARLRRMRQSPQFRDGTFHNATYDPPTPAAGAMRREWRERGQRRPKHPIPVVTPTFGELDPDRLGVVWLGHATALLEIEGRRVLLDPVWSRHCSPVPGVGPARLHRPPVPMADLPELTAILISHDHYDHLDLPAIRALAGSSAAPFVVPLGVGAHLARWGVPEDRIIELDWDEETTVGGLRLIATPAQHFSGRTLARNRTLWSGWVVAGERRKVFYTGDSGYFDGYARIGEKYGPFDASLMQIGAYSEAWPDIHMTPEEAVAAHRDLRGGLFVPVHWGTFSLAFHSWAEPIERLLTALDPGTAVVVPQPGERVDVGRPAAPDLWWRAIAGTPVAAADPAPAAAS